MKLINPSVILKDGLWYGYTANSEAALVKISNQEEVSRIVLTSRGCSTGVTIEDLKKSVHRRLSELDVYKLDGYVMEVVNLCFPTERIAAISPIQKQEPAPDNQEELWREVDRIFNVKWSYGIPGEVMQELKDKFTITRKP